MEPQIAIKGGPSNGPGSMSFHVKSMLNFFAPGEDNSDDRRTMKQHFLKIRDQAEPYSYNYVDPVPNVLSYTDAIVAEKTLTIEDVTKWVDLHDRHGGRLRFFADLPKTPYFVLVAKLS